MVKIRKTKDDIMNFFFDSETTGVPEKDWSWDVHYMKWPYILSLAWKYKGVTHEYLVHQCGRKVPAAATAVNGITTEMANNDSICKQAKDVYRMFLTDALCAANIIGFNTYFDTAMFKANVMREFGKDSEEVRMAIEALHKDKRMDVMRSAKILFNGRWPKLTALHELLFNKPFNAHEAGEDVLATERCFYELKKRKLI